MAGNLTAMIASIFNGGVATDPYYPYTTLLLPGNGTNGAQNNTFLDGSTNNFTITRNGNTTQGTFSPFSQTGWGNYLNSSNGNYLSVTASNAFDVGTNDFTAELWFYINPGATSYNGWGRAHVLGGAEATSSSRIAIVVNGNSLGSSGLSWSVGSTSGSYGTAIAQGVWHHVALVRSGTAITLYLNGIAVSTGNSSASIANNIQYIGAFRATDDQFSDYFYGYVSNVRFIKNQALFSGSTIGITYFTPSTTPLTTTSVGSTGTGVAASITGTVSLLTCQSNRFLDQTGKTITVDGSPSVQAFSPFNPTASWSAATYGGSGYFDGSGDYLTAGNGASETNLSSDSSIEVWFYPLATNKVLTAKYSGGTNQFYINCDSSNKIYAEYLGSTYYAKTSTGSYTLNAWNHLLITKSSTTAKMWLNGVYEGSWTVSSVNSSTNAIGIGGTTIGGTSFNGYIGGAKYSNIATETGTSNITVPTTPMTAGTGTVLLLNFTNAGIYDATSKNDLETVGNAQISTTQSKWGGSSMSFDGTGDYLFEPHNTLFEFGSGDFTIEFWARANSLSGTYTGVVGVWVAGGTSTANSWNVTLNAYNATNKLGFSYTQSSTTYDLAFNATTSTGSWDHYAIVRSGGTLYGFKNGTSQALSSGSSSISGAINNGTNGLYVGTVGTAAGGTDFNGYIQDLRITKGIARYTANFTAPTAAFPTQ